MFFWKMRWLRSSIKFLKIEETLEMIEKDDEALKNSNLKRCPKICQNWIYGAYIGVFLRVSW